MKMKTFLALIAVIVVTAVVIACGVGSSWFTNGDIRTWFNSWGQVTAPETPDDESEPNEPDTGDNDKTDETDNPEDNKPEIIYVDLQLNYYDVDEENNILETTTPLVPDENGVVTVKYRRNRIALPTIEGLSSDEYTIKYEYHSRSETEFYEITEEQFLSGNAGSYRFEIEFNDSNKYARVTENQITLVVEPMPVVINPPVAVYASNGGKVNSIFNNSVELKENSKLNYKSWVEPFKNDLIDIEYRLDISPCLSVYSPDKDYEDAFSFEVFLSSGFTIYLGCYLNYHIEESDIACQLEFSSGGLTIDINDLIDSFSIIFTGISVRYVAYLVDGTEVVFKEFFSGDTVYERFITVIENQSSYVDVYDNLTSVTETLIVYERKPSIELPPVPVKEGHTFVGWYLDEELTIPYDGSPIYEPTDFYAKFEINKYTVTFNSDGGSSVTGQNVDWNTVLILETPEKAGYNFVGWFLNDGTQYINQPVTEDTTLTAHWEVKMCTVTFYVDGEIYKSMQVEYGVSFNGVVQEIAKNNFELLAVFSANGELVENFNDLQVMEDYLLEVREFQGVEKFWNIVKNNVWWVVGGVAVLITLCCGIGVVAVKKRS